MPSKPCVTDVSTKESVALFDVAEIKVGELLGIGGFSDVFEVVAVHLRAPTEAANVHNEKNESHKGRCEETRKSIANDSDSRYVVKFLQQRVVQDPLAFSRAAADLASEAKILCSLDHPHIIKIRGMPRQGISGFTNGEQQCGSFLLLDRLCDTLDKRLEVWAAEEEKNRGRIRATFLGFKEKKRSQFFTERLLVAFDIAGALTYLHEKNIIYNDLKLENVGFDFHGKVKLFDFGLSRELIPQSKTDYDPHYKPCTPNNIQDLSEKIGTLKYMAPEIAQCKPYNLKADVYTFGVVTWEILALQRAYAKYKPRAHAILVLNGTVRPPVDKRWPLPLSSLLQRSWSSDVTLRPAMKCVHGILREEMVRLRDGDDSGLENHNFPEASKFSTVPSC